MTGIHKVETSVMLPAGGPMVSFERVTEATSVVQIGIRKCQPRELLLRSKMIDMEVAEPAEMGLMNEAICTAVQEVLS
jgi:hypothetical protein